MFDFLFNRKKTRNKTRKSKNILLLHKAVKNVEKRNKRKLRGGENNDKNSDEISWTDTFGKSSGTKKSVSKFKTGKTKTRRMSRIPRINLHFDDFVQDWNDLEANQSNSTAKTEKLLNKNITSKTIKNRKNPAVLLYKHLYSDNS